ncbi:hypothetical protein [Erythrobacter sp. Alg231-14]|uniref:hypothetical protein n=1 Tax=Erythrobacter sp. Alg231-14 TaxID=1922225 RepID=UPI000D558115
MICVRSLRLALPIALIASVATPLFAQKGKAPAPAEVELPVESVTEVEFAVSDAMFVMPMPDGYCLPRGEEKVLSDETAADDIRNRTLVDMDVCGTFAVYYVLVKTPRAEFQVPMARDAFFAMMEQQLENSDLVETVMQEDIDMLEESSDGAITLETQDYGFDGFDDDCLYASGIMRITMEGERDKALAAGCTTLIGGYIFAVHAYDFTDNPDTLETLKRRARDIALSIQEK